jgi:hypothetical protein
MRIAVPALLLLGFGLWDVTSDAQKKKVVPKAKPVTQTRAIAKTRVLVPCPSLKCGNVSTTTRHALIPISDDAFLAPIPNPICACLGDDIEWTYDNRSQTKDKDIYIQDVVPFLDNGACKHSKSVKKTKQEKATCGIVVAKSGTYKYMVKGSHFLDPEVEVQGGIHPASPSPLPND